MELEKFIVGEECIVILVPRFIRSNVVSPMITEYLTAKGYKVSVFGSEAIHKSSPMVNSANTNVLIYENLVSAVFTKLSPRETAGLVSIVLIEWGFDYNLLEELAKKNTNHLRYLKFQFLHEPRIVSFHLTKIKVSSDMADWYAALTSTDTSVDVKAMAGNHYYRDMQPKERVEAMVSPANYNYHASIIGSPNTPHTPYNHESAMQNVKVVTNEAQISHVSELNMDTKVYKSGNATIAADSPKIHAVVREFTKDMGKYLIVTSFRFAFGLNLISGMLTRIFGTAPLILDPTFSKEKADAIVKEFNAADNSILITASVPILPLINVSRVIVMDTYNPNFITEVVKNVCVYKCGSSGAAGTVTPLVVSLFAIVYPFAIGETTYEEDQSAKAMEVLRTYNRQYDLVENSASPVGIEEDNFKVYDVIASDLPGI